MAHETDDTKITKDKFDTLHTASLSSRDARIGSMREGPMFSFMTDMMNDLRARAPYYWDDWKKPRNTFTVVNAVVYAFMVQLIPALVFSEMLDQRTDGRLAVAETIMSAGIIGVIYAVVAGQPLVILGITGPVVILLGSSSKLAGDLFDADYFTFFWWTCFWAGLLHMLSAMTGIVNLVWKITPFTLQIFELFNASAFIYSGIMDVVFPIELTSSSTPIDVRAGAYAGLVISLGTTLICWVLHFADTWVYWTRQTRTFLACYNMVIALVMVTGISYLPGVDLDGYVQRVNVRVTPWDWQPTADRQWWVNPTEGIDIKGIFGAMFPGLMFYMLFFLDHNVSSILTQLPKYNLQKPSTYHWDFFVLGVTFLPCGFLGLPPGNGLIPQAQLHTRSLCTREYKEIHGVKREVYTYCEEQRYSGFCQAALMFLALALMTVISWIPVGALFGVLLYLGFVALHGNAIWERVRFNAMVPKRRPPVPIVTEVKSWRAVQLYTFIQIACTGVIFGVSQFASIGYIFPALIVALVPFRAYVLPLIFDEEDLMYLDPIDHAFTPPTGGKDESVKDKDGSVAAGTSKVQADDTPSEHMGQRPGPLSPSMRRPSDVSELEEVALPHGFCVEYPGQQTFHHIRRPSDVSELEEVLPHGFCTEYPGHLLSSPHPRRAPHVEH